MNSEQKNKIAKLYFEIGELHGRTLSKDTLITLTNSFSDLPFDAVFKEMGNWFLNGTHFPLPAHIRAKLSPTITDKDEAIDAVNRIIAAVSLYGYPNLEQAKNYIGELGWEVVKRFGGWTRLCETLDSENEGMIRAQMRELAQVVFKKSLVGDLNTAPALPQAIKNLIPEFKLLD